MKIRKSNKKNIIFFTKIIFFQSYIGIASCVYYLIAAVKNLIKYLPSLSNKKDLNINCIPKARSEILRILKILKTSQSLENKLPWLCKKNEFSLKELITIRVNYIKNTWKSYFSYNIFFREDIKNIYRWGILSSYPDQPIHSFFDFGNLIQHFPDDIKSEYFSYNIERHDQKNLSFIGKNPPILWDILQHVVELQTEWAGGLFFLPISSTSEKDCDDAFYKPLYRFSVHLIGGLVIIAEMLSSIESGLAFTSAYSKKLSADITKFFNKLDEPKVLLADLIFIHSAVQKIWLIINGRSKDEITKFNNRNLIYNTDIMNFKKKFPIAEQFKKLFLNNPVTILLFFDFLSDLKLLNPLDKNQYKILCHIFKNEIDEEVLYWLANHTYSSLMNPYMKEGLTCFGNRIAQIPAELFQYRINCFGVLVNTLFEELEENKEVFENFSCFCIFFYDILLRDWMIEIPADEFPNHPLPELQPEVLQDHYPNEIVESETLFSRILIWCKVKESNSFKSAFSTFLSPINKLINFNKRPNSESIKETMVSFKQIYKKAKPYLTELIISED
ncbi:MAG: hypothetical protein ABIK92_06600 [Pseudomonadota bacterium]